MQADPIARFRFLRLEMKQFLIHFTYQCNAKILPQFMHKMTGDTRSRSCQRMAKGNRTAIYVEFIDIDIQNLGACECLNSECFVDLRTVVEWF